MSDNKYQCSCILCRNVITTNNLQIHYNSKQCKSGALFSEWKKRINRDLKCSYCDFTGKNNNSIAQHEKHCVKNLNHVKKNPSYGMKGKKGSNQFVKAKLLGLPLPEVSENVRIVSRKTLLTRPRSYSSKESKKVFDTLLEQITDYGDVRSHSLNREYFIKNKDKTYFYDLTFLDLKIIIEYQGVAWHPKSPSENFKVLYESMGTIQDLWNKDREKEKAAIKKGFEVLYIWSDNVESDIQKVIFRIKEVKKLLDYNR